MNNAQTSLEYLLIIGLAVLVAAIVIMFVVNMLGTSTDQGDIATMKYECTVLKADDLSQDCKCIRSNLTGANCCSGSSPISTLSQTVKSNVTCN
ncbi:MAG: class III signal peptide-containing protein [Candidatus ainarchaeum sp.]|nr:class III signal peptide-containing protein [Candidatus ainarchaeum sp.]